MAPLLGLQQTLRFWSLPTSSHKLVALYTLSQDVLASGQAIETGSNAMGQWCFHTLRSHHNSQSHHFYQLLSDLQAFILLLTSLQHEILLMGDFNGVVNDNNLQAFLSALKLTDLQLPFKIPTTTQYLCMWSKDWFYIWYSFPSTGCLVAEWLSGKHALALAGGGRFDFCTHHLFIISEASTLVLGGHSDK